MKSLIRRHSTYVALPLILLSLFVSVNLSPFASHIAHASTGYSVTMTNGIRYDTGGNQIDAHDGTIYEFGGIYYWYGTSYKCGFTYNVDNTPFCGFNIYQSTNLVDWLYDGPMFDAGSSIYQNECSITLIAANGIGCYDITVAYNAPTNRYVAWFNSYGTFSQGTYIVMTSPSPTGPWTRSATPNLPSDQMGAATIFVDSNGVGYLAYTLPSSNYDPGIIQLSSNFLSTVGPEVVLNNPASEPPNIIKHNGIYYLIYSHKNCAYCGGTGGYDLIGSVNAASPLVAFNNSVPNRFSFSGVGDTSMQNGGQIDGIAAINTTSGITYLTMTDQWAGMSLLTPWFTPIIDLNQSRAPSWWTPLTFGSSGQINPAISSSTFTLNLVSASAATNSQPSGSSYSSLADPTRIVDTTIGSGEGLNVQIGGMSADGQVIPLNATAAVFTLTEADATSAGYLNVVPEGTRYGYTTSDLNFGPNESPASTSVTSALSNGYMTIYNYSGTTRVIVDLEGYFIPGVSAGLYTPITPVRILDASKGIGPGQIFGLPVRGGVEGDTIPPSATAVVVNVTSDNATTPSYYTVDRYGASDSGLTSQVNFDAGQIKSVTAFVPLSGSAIQIYNHEGYNTPIVDLVGYFSTSGYMYHPISPLCLIDSFAGTANAPLAANVMTEVPIGETNVADIELTVAPITAIPGWVDVFPSGLSGNGVSINYPGINSPNDNSNQILVQDNGSSIGAVNFYSHNAPINYIVDELGWWSLPTR